ncbi:MAG: DUF1993 domain-containing protein [Gammaproteobacteria bacterium]
MSLSMYQASVPVLTRALKNLDGVLRKGEAFAEAKTIDPAVLINDRLAPDMFPLARQIQMATDIARRGVARLAGVEPSKFEDTEKTFADLHDRINRSITFLESFQPQQIDGTENKPLVVEIRNKQVNFTGREMLLNFTLPNVFFHCTTAYAILRHNGVDLGKPDYLGTMPG